MVLERVRAAVRGRHVAVDATHSKFIFFTCVLCIVLIHFCKMMNDACFQKSKLQCLIYIMNLIYDGGSVSIRVNTADVVYIKAAEQRESISLQLLFNVCFTFLQ